MSSIPEEPTQENIQKLLDSLPPGLTPVERVLLCNDGTNQTLLSVLFGAPIKVEVLCQYELVPYQVIIRWTKLVAVYPEKVQAPGEPFRPTAIPAREVTVCLAESVIPIKANNEGFITAIREQKMGIGQILSATRMEYERRIFGMYADQNVVARNYQIFARDTEKTGDTCVSVVITEVFPREAIMGAGRTV